MKVTIAGHTAVGKNQCNALRFAAKYPGWHTFARDQSTRRTIAGLYRRGAIEVWQNMFRLAPPPS